jgi:hypothetical protein
MSAQTVYHHVADFIASMDPKRVLEIKAPETMSTRWHKVFLNTGLLADLQPARVKCF